MQSTGLIWRQEGDSAGNEGMMRADCIGPLMSSRYRWAMYIQWLMFALRSPGYGIHLYRCFLRSALKSGGVVVHYESSCRWDAEAKNRAISEYTGHSFAILDVDTFFGFVALQYFINTFLSKCRVTSQSHTQCVRA